MREYKIAVIGGDGIGPEVISAGTHLLKAVDKKHNLGLRMTYFDWGAEKWINEKIGLPKSALEELRSHYDAIYFGALGDPRIPDMAHGREILLGLRFGLDLYVNLRPVQLLDERFCPLKNKTKSDINITIFRENTEDSYVSMGGRLKPGTSDEVAIDESVHTRKGVERIIRAAFEYAQKYNRKRVTLVDKSNAIRYGGALWQEMFSAVSKVYPDIEKNHMFVDVAAMEMVRVPEMFDVIVTTNLFGDILSDLGAGIVGGLGLMASANIHPGKIGLFEPVHGSAPGLAGKNIANPMAAFLTAAMMLEYLGFSDPAHEIRLAIDNLLLQNHCTPDLGGSLSTTEVTARMCQYVH